MYAAYATASGAAADADCRHAASRGRSRATLVEPGMGRSGDGPWLLPGGCHQRCPQNQVHPRIPAAAAAAPRLMRGAAAPATAAPGMPTAPTAQQPALRTTGTRHGGTAAIGQPVSLSPLTSDCYYADPDRMASAATANSAALPA